MLVGFSLLFRTLQLARLPGRGDPSAPPPAPRACLRRRRACACASERASERRAALGPFGPAVPSPGACGVPCPPPSPPAAAMASVTARSAEVRSFYRQVARSLPALVHKFWLNDFVTVAQLRSTVTAKFREHAAVRNPDVQKTLMHRAHNEFNMIKKRHKQRHHLLRDYVHHGVNTQHAAKPPTSASQFLQDFNSNAL